MQNHTETMKERKTLRSTFVAELQVLLSEGFCGVEVGSTSMSGQSLAVVSNSFISQDLLSTACHCFCN